MLLLKTHLSKDTGASEPPTNTMTDIIAKVVGLSILLIAVVILGPLLTIWAWNTLFGSVHSIDYTVTNWVAVVIIGALFRASVSVKKD